MSRLYHKPGPPGSVLLATPSYGPVEPSYAFALFQSGQELERAGINAELAIHAWDCHVDDARNRLAKLFLDSTCTDLVFLDADVRWKPRDLIKLLSYDRDIVGGAYPQKNEAESYPVEFFDGEIWADPDGLIEVAGLATGFLRIRRVVLERLAEQSPKFAYPNDDKATTPLIFEREISSLDRRRGGDITFCHKAREAGFKVYLTPEMTFDHTGPKTRCGSVGFYLRSKENGPLATAFADLRAGDFRSDLFDHLHNAWGNPFAATGDLLSACALLARESKKPIMEFGSGLSTLVMAAANPDIHVYAVEHDLDWIKKVNETAESLGIGNITVIRRDVKDGWYDFEPSGDYGLTLVDGPPRRLGGRAKADVPNSDVYIFDDANDPGVASAIARVAEERGLKIARMNVGHPRCFAVLH